MKTNGDEGLVVNQIGSYSGRHLIDIFDDSRTTELEIESDSDWTVTLTDAFATATHSDAGGLVAGTGDDVLFLLSDGTKAEVGHAGEDNFVLKGYGGTRAELAVNEIGDYSGTVRLTSPALVQITADPGTTWTIDAS